MKEDVRAGKTPKVVKLKVVKKFRPTVVSLKVVLPGYVDFLCFLLGVF